MENLYLAIDIGGTDLKSGLISQSGTITGIHRVRTPNNLDDFLQALQYLIDISMKNHPKGIAICSPGKIVNNTIYFGGALPFLDGINFQKRFPQYDLPISVINDGKASLLAESWLGNLKNIDKGASLTLGTAVGGGIMINHHLILGEHKQAAEFSVMEMDYHQTGFTGSAAVIASAVEMIKRINKLNHVSDLTNGKLALQSVTHNDAAKKIFEDFCQKVAYLIINIQSVVDLKRYVIGGGVSANPLVVPEINRQFDTICKKTPIIKHCLSKPEIMKARFTSKANLLGALYHLLQQEGRRNV